MSAPINRQVNRTGAAVVLTLQGLVRETDDFINGCVHLRCSGALAGSLVDWHHFSYHVSPSDHPTWCLFMLTAIFSWFEGFVWNCLGMSVCSSLFFQSLVNEQNKPNHGKHRCAVLKSLLSYPFIFTWTDSHSHSAVWKRIHSFQSGDEMVLLPPMLRGTINSSRGGCSFSRSLTNTSTPAPCVLVFHKQCGCRVLVCVCVWKASRLHQMFSVASKERIKHSRTEFLILNGNKKPNKEIMNDEWAKQQVVNDRSDALVHYFTVLPIII